MSSGLSDGFIKNPIFDAEGNLSARLNSPAGIYGDIVSIVETPIIQVSFVYKNHPQLVSSTTTGSGSTSNSNQMAQVNTGAATSSSASIESIAFLKYRTGQSSLATASCIFDTPVSGNTQQVGLFDSDNGFGFGYNGTDFGVFRIRNGVTTWTTKNNWNIDRANGDGPSGFNLDPQSGNIYKIEFAYHGFAGPTYFIFNPDDDKFILVHREKYANSFSVPFVTNPSFPVCIRTENTTNNTDITVKSGAFYGALNGPFEPIGIEYSAGWSATGIDGTETQLLTLRNDPTFNGVSNKSQIYLKFISSAIETNDKSQRIRIRRNSTFSTPIWTEIDPGNSVASELTGGTDNLDGTIILDFVLASGVGKEINLLQYSEQIPPNGTLSVSSQAFSGTGGNSFGSLTWIEDQ